MDDDLMCQLGMSDKLQKLWLLLKNEHSGYANMYEVAAYLRKSRPELFDLRKPGDCWGFNGVPVALQYSARNTAVLGG
jgi:hypothetical protein